MSGSEYPGHSAGSPDSLLSVNVLLNPSPTASAAQKVPSLAMLPAILYGSCAPLGSLRNYSVPYGQGSTFGMKPRHHAILPQKRKRSCEACGDHRHHSMYYYHCPKNPRHAAEKLMSSSRFPFLKLSTEMQAKILTLASQHPGIVHKAIRSCKEILSIILSGGDDRLSIPMWRAYHDRMVSSSPDSKFMSHVSWNASKAAGGWRKLCLQKVMYDWR